MDIKLFHIRRKEVDEAHKKKLHETWGSITQVAESLQTPRSLSEIEKTNLSQFLGLLAATTDGTQYARSQTFAKETLSISPQVMLLSALCIDKSAVKDMGVQVKKGLLQRLRDNADSPLLNSPFIRHLAAWRKFSDPFDSPFLIPFWSETYKDSDPVEQAAEVSDPATNHGSTQDRAFNALDVMQNVDAYNSLFNYIPGRFSEETFNGRRC